LPDGDDADRPARDHQIGPGRRVEVHHRVERSPSLARVVAAPQGEDESDADPRAVAEGLDRSVLRVRETAFPCLDAWAWGIGPHHAAFARRSAG
jgi:hypothetical protein